MKTRSEQPSFKQKADSRMQNKAENKMQNKTDSKMQNKADSRMSNCSLDNCTSSGINHIKIVSSISKIIFSTSLGTIKLIATTTKYINSANTIQFIFLPFKHFITPPTSQQFYRNTSPNW